MATSIYSALNMAKMGLMTHQIAIEVTGQNISNVNNKNFTRQELMLEASAPVRYGASPGYIGTGVRPITVTRQQDRFLESQRQVNNSEAHYWDSRQNFLSRLEVVFNETSGNGLNSLFDNFFQSWQQMASNPRGLTERTEVTSQGSNITSMMNKLNGDMKNLRTDLDGKITSSVAEINRLTAEIVGYNKAIHESEGHNVHANDFRDQREAAIRELAGYVDITTVEDSNKQVMVNLSTGRPLIIGQTAFELSSRVRSDDANASDIYWKDTDGNFFDITSDMTGGDMGSWITMRDTDLPARTDELDLLAATFIRDINSIHQAGYGLNGATGQDFFTGTNVATTQHRNNTGTGTISATVIAPDNLNLHKFQIDYVNAGSVNVQDLTMGTTTNYGSLAAATGSFTARGMTVTIGGAPANGDTFTVNPSADASRNIAVHANIISDKRLIAAGLTTDQGNGENALRMAQAQDAYSMNKATPGSVGTATFAEYYNSIVGQVGVDTNISISSYNQQEAIVHELENRHEQISGVSLDEEMINLIKFQHAYQAASRLVNVIDELLQTVIALK